ncbi:uncharacterized protein BJ212DRAFT_1477283 [Suillus subaureus]|uniref:Telomere-associated protein Rif1 N-terminal domain-containing protein n=1 Tax=Suillus subaureus TaxID=48587 RepID=A0A9P7EIT3_9AGAM|nr:uncharacterized protein BJ212DRAFT_1477283 [Suillus subaureus]KAG1822874.1 hypothetical protein BJ212DRAFT_1477283 [Suillus subaureus]
MTGELTRFAPGHMNPLHDTTYLTSPLESIVNSLEPNSLHSNHDLLDAYNTFSNRIRAEAQELQQSSASLPALESLRAKAPGFSQALRRDLALAHIDPFIPPRALTSGESLLSGPRQSTADVVKHAGDSSAICQQALCALSDIFRFHNLYSLFSGSDISSLLAEILNITHSRRLPILNSAKVFSLALWILGSQRLPEGLLSSQASDIVSVLRSTLYTQPIGQQFAQHTEDGLKGVCHLLEFYPTTFFVHAIQQLPLVLSHLLCNSYAVRLQAVLVLGRMALSLLNSSFDISLDHRKVISDFVLDFLDKQWPKTASTQISEFHHIAKAAIAAEEKSELVEGPVWLLSMMSSLVILSDHCLFSHSDTFKYFMQLAVLGYAHVRSVVRGLAQRLWSCLAIAFTRIPDQDIRTKEAVFLYLDRKPLSDVGIAVVTMLLNTSATPSSSSSEQITSFDAVSRALTLVHDMAHDSDKRISSDGLSLLHKLMGGVGAPAPSTPGMTTSSPRLPTSLFDGSLLTGKWDRSTLRSIYPSSLTEVRHLSEGEIVRHRIRLRSIWLHLAQSRISYESCLPPKLIEIWQSLLLAESQLTQAFHHAISADLAEESALVIAGFIPQTPGNSEEPDSTILMTAQVRALAAITQLWSMMKNAFTPKCISIAAKIILTNLLKHDFRLSDKSVLDRWSKLCADLIVAAMPLWTQELFAMSSSQVTETIARQLWSLVAQSLISQSEISCWLDTVKLLVVPLGSWTMSDVELDVWNSLLQKTLTSASQASTELSTVIDAIAQAVLPVACVDRMIFLQIPLSHLLSCFIPDASLCPPDSLLSIVNSVLKGTYKTSVELMNGSLQLLHSIQTTIVVSSPSHVLHILESLRAGLQLWIEDKEEVLTENEFNLVIMPLYSDTLAVLERHPLGLDFLNSVEFFLAAGFSRIIAPALAPLAFERFWRATYHGQHQFSSNIPAGVISVLKAFTTVFGGDLLAGFPPDSQSTTSSGFPSSPIRGNHSAAEHLSSAVFDDTHCVEHTFGNATLRSVSVLPFHSVSTVLPRDPASLSQGDMLHNPQNIPSSADEIPALNIPDSRQVGIIPLNGQSLSPRFSPLTKSTHQTGQGSKRSHKYQDTTPQKRRRTISGTQKSHPSRFISEPTTSRLMPPVPITRLYSAPIGQSKRVFDGVVLPTLRQVVAAERSLELSTRSSAETFQFNDPHRSVQTLSIASDDSDDYDSWEIRCAEIGFSEMEVDNSLAGVPWDSLMESNSILQEGTMKAQAAPRTEQRSKSQEASQHVTQYPTPLRRSNTGSGHLDALREAYAAVASGGSQIPVHELVQATRLVHQIGAALSERMNKQFGGSS